MLAGIPTVVYGYFALTAVTPFLQDIGIDVHVFNALSAGLVMGIMILPTVASLSDDAMTAVPMALREGAYGLGRLEAAGLDPRGGARRAVGHRGVVRARDLARGRRDDDRRDRGRPAGRS